MLGQSGKIQKAKKGVFYGPEGIGKSTLAAQLPRPIFIDTEGSTTEMDVARTKKPTSWTMLRQEVEWVKQQGGRYGTLVIDTIDWAEMLCVQDVCAKHNTKGIDNFGIESLGYGKGYVYVAEEFGRFLNQLSDVVDAGIHVILTAHSQISKFEQPDEMGAYDRYTLKLGQKTGSRTAALVKEWADLLLFINYKTFSVATDSNGNKHKGQGGQRTVYATHHPAWDAKNRQGLPNEFPLDYSHIAHIFTAGVSPAAPSPTPPPEPPKPPVWSTPAVPEQPAASVSGPRKALADLMAANGVSEAEIQLVVSKRGYFPLDTPLGNYPDDFIGGVLVAAWPAVFGMIQEIRASVPFPV